MIKKLGKIRELDTKIRLMRAIFAVFGPSAIVIGGWMAIAPRNFWGLLQVDYVDPISQVLYGSALVGVGVMCALGYSRPLKYIGVFQFMMVYKMVAALALTAHQSYLVASGQGAHIAGWIIAFLWLSMSVMSAVVYPWGKGQEIVERMRAD